MGEKQNAFTDNYGFSASVRLGRSSSPPVLSFHVDFVPSRAEEFTLYQSEARIRHALLEKGFSNLEIHLSRQSSGSALAIRFEGEAAEVKAAEQLVRRDGNAAALWCGSAAEAAAA